MDRKQLLIGGEWRDAEGGKTQPVINPATEEVIAEVGAASAGDVDAAVAAARAAFDGPWRKLSARERGRLIWRVGERLIEKLDEVARLETLHNGKPITESRHIEMPMAAECLQYFAGWADKIHGETVPVKGQRRSSTRCASRWGSSRRSSRGTFRCSSRCGRSRPRSRPATPSMLKPASQTPLTALAFGADCARGRLAARRAERHHGQRRDRRDRRSSSIPASTRSRSPATPDRPRRHAHGGRDVKHITLELGGKSPNIVFPDADLDAAVRGATVGIFYGKGEVCAAGSRLLVDRSIKDQFAIDFAAESRRSLGWLSRIFRRTAN